MQSSWPNVPNTPQCGIKVVCTSGTPNALVKMRGSSKNYTIKGVEVDGGYSGACDGSTQALSTNDHTYSAVGEWREGLLITDNYVHNTSRTGMYIGPNVDQSADLKNRDNEISYNYLHDLGCDAIKYKNAVSGHSSIHHNYIDTTGVSGEPERTGCTDIGIILFESGYTDVYNNTVIDTARSGIAQYVQAQPKASYATLKTRIYNNVVWRSGADGISSNRRDSIGSLPQAIIFNNTVVGSASIGINVGSEVPSGCTVRDNIVASSGHADYSTSQCAQSNNIRGNVDNQRFVDANSGDFNLTESSPARNKGVSDESPVADHADISRPQEGKGDPGAFEFVPGGTRKEPKAPKVVRE